MGPGRSPTPLGPEHLGGPQLYTLHITHAPHSWNSAWLGPEVLTPAREGDRGPWGGRQTDAASLCLETSPVLGEIQTRKELRVTPEQSDR